ncbi:MerR family transcriptional regulator [Paenibacillus lutrae]|uniref:Methyltransferase domain-containing protein n=1 Tax=Paenibacillus lutrae TaxID=2078573 RepID=A0A7X3FLH5_9BACL|nr:MerR family transcriptional regulator [Paenibacillus lutrae]MVP01669.1 methyltransferase domain-containing protein [Paenibacillus lutrae]
MQIKDAAQRLGISTRTIRFYEEKGLISPAKCGHNGYRTFTERELWRLQTIVALRESGMTLSDIQGALDKIECGDHDELLHYLELQRAVLFGQWLDTRHTLDTTDHMIHLLQQNRSMPLDDFYRLAANSKSQRELRLNWRDAWNFDQLASTHDERVYGGDTEYPHYSQALQELVKEINPKPGEHGLDLGTGTGNLAGLLQNTGAVVAGVDQSREMLRICRAKYPRMTTKIGNFLAVPYTDGQFDFVASSFSFHHLSDKQQLLALAEMDRVLKPQGRIGLVDRTSVIRGAETALPGYLGWFGPHGFDYRCRELTPGLVLVVSRRL